MSKYNNTLDINGNNSAAFILKAVRPNTTVLEFGADNGYMTQYLKETLGCRVHIVEINEENAVIASKYAASCLSGETDGDIENYKWKNIEKCDHIIFADVLEHLYDPYTVLKEAAKRLKKNGTILISIPNVSHNSVIIDLINNNFEYRDLGLLDSSHIRFFTRKTLLKMVNDAGLVVSRESNTICAVENTEFKNSYIHIPIAMAEILKERKDGNIYQFIWELTK